MLRSHLSSLIFGISSTNEHVLSKQKNVAMCTFKRSYYNTYPCTFFTGKSKDKSRKKINIRMKVRRRSGDFERVQDRLAITLLRSATILNPLCNK